MSVVVSSLAWTVAREEIFRELRDYCHHKSRTCGRLWQRKVFYLFTCEYCFSHWVTLFLLVLIRFRLFVDDWRGYILSFFAVVWLANALMSLYSRLRVDIRSERAEAEIKEKAAGGGKE